MTNLEYKSNKKFFIKSKFNPSGDQPYAIKKIYENLNKNIKNQTLLGVTGSGKTFTMAHVIEKTQKPTLILAPNTLPSCSTSWINISPIYGIISSKQSGKKLFLSAPFSQS